MTVTTQERTQLRDSVSRLLADTPGEAAWRGLHDIGVIGLRVPEALGGLGLPVDAAEPIFEAIGEHGAAVPFLTTSVLAAGLLQPQRSLADDTLLRDIASGAAQVAVAGIDRRLRAQVSATPTATGWRLDGDARLVIDAPQASWLIVAARTEGHTTALLAVRRDAAGVSSHDYATIDGRRASDIRLIAVEATLLSADAHVSLAAVTDEAIACLATEAGGLMRRLVSDTVGYTQQRQQFGQPLARFQVVQHRLVDMHIAARRVGAIARRAMAALDAPWRERGRLASAAKATAVEAGRFVAQQAVQLHGGMGMTDELAVGRYFKRLTAIETELGGVDEHSRRYAALSFE